LTDWRFSEALVGAALSDQPRDEVTRMAVRIVELEDTVEALNRTIAGLNDRLTRRKTA
jgi:hypothetical protein